MKRSIPIQHCADGRIQCDVCPQPATVEALESANREQAFYCDYDARRTLGRGDNRRDL